MKAFLLAASMLFCLQQFVFSQNIGINATGALPHASAMLDVSATDKGMLVPRMTTAQRTVIASPATGLLVFDTDNKSFWFYNGNAWTDLSAASSGSFWSLSGSNIYNSNTGNVGIGINNPDTKLTMQTPINTLGFKHIGGADSIIVVEGIGGVSASIGTTTNHAFRLAAGSDGRLSVYPTGDVVVGPNASGSFGKFSVVTLNNSYGISHLGEGGNILATRMGGTSAGIGTFSNTNMRLFSNGVSAVYISAATGNIGMGTDNPSNTRLNLTTPNGQYGLTHTDGNVTFSTYLGGGINGAWLGTRSNHPLFFYTNNKPPSMIITPEGLVGINTLVPDPFYKLSVQGNIRANEIVVETGWADYVFDASYQLHPLAEVEKFIQQNKHLPNIPSAKEIQEKGLPVGEVQKRMMEKIEELTLYVIELQKEIEQLKKSNHENK